MTDAYAHNEGRALLVSAHPPGRGSGAALRNQLVFDALRSVFPRVDVVSFATATERRFANDSVTLVPRPERSSRLHELASILRGGLYFLPEREARLAERLRALQGDGTLERQYDVVWAHSPLMARAAYSACQADVRVLDVDTSAGSAMAAGVPARREASLAARAHSRLHAFAVAREERRRCNESHHVVVASPAEPGRLGPVRPPVSVVPNAVPGPPSGVTRGVADGMLFVGSLDYGPNVAAVRILVERVMPFIDQHRPDTTLTVAGRDPAPEVDALCARENVSLVANPDSLAELYASAGVVVAPMGPSGGTNIKVLEAMAHCVPVVATTQAVDGIGVVPGRDVIVADEPEAFAAACVELLGDEQHAAAIARAGHGVWAAGFTPDLVSSRIVDLVESLRAEALTRAA